MALTYRSCGASTSETEREREREKERERREESQDRERRASTGRRIRKKLTARLLLGYEKTSRARQLSRNRQIPRGSPESIELRAYRHDQPRVIKEDDLILRRLSSSSGPRVLITSRGLAGFFALPLGDFLAPRRDGRNWRAREPRRDQVGGDIEKLIAPFESFLSLLERRLLSCTLICIIARGNDVSIRSGE